MNRAASPSRMELNWGSRHTWQTAVLPAGGTPMARPPAGTRPAPPAPAGTRVDGGEVGDGAEVGDGSGGDYGDGPGGEDSGSEVGPAPPVVPAAAGALPLLREVSFRTRISLLVGVAVAVAVAAAALVSYVAVSRQIEQQANSDLQSAVNLVPSLVRFGAPGLLNPSPFINFQLRTGDQVQALIAENQGGP